MGPTEEIHVYATAPGGGVHGEIRGRDRVDVYFSTGTYDRSSETELERRLEGLARLLWAASERARRSRHPEVAGGGRETDRDRLFFEQRDALTAEGRSDDDRITITVQGMRRWRVRIADDTLRAVRERDFCAAVQVAASRLIADQLAQVIQLRGRIYR
ncbi:hypothetical protein [Actinoplanes subglobosus]|uniref:Uncharacterized protein n=1 Tax=Actinoplanes subglobosus TaxID=1547892 RepID=A0ABV8INJ5_9ACTN